MLPTVAMAVAVGALLVAPSVAGAEVYRCNVDGKTVYSDKPCATGKSIEVAVPKSAPEDAGHARLQQEANLGRVVVGQTPAQVLAACGEPRKKNIDTRVDGRTEQWVYDRADGTECVHFRVGSRVEHELQQTDASEGRAVSAAAVASRDRCANARSQIRRAPVGSSRHAQIRR